MTRVMTASTGGGAATEVIRADETGRLVRQAMLGRDEYVSPPRGTRCKLLISGISEDFPMENKFENRTDMMCRVELEVVQAEGNWGRLNKGARFTLIQKPSIHEKSNMGKFFSAILGLPKLPNPFDIEAMIGTTFVCTTGQSTGGYPTVPLDFIESDKTDAPWVDLTARNGAVPRPGAGEAVPAADPAPEGGDFPTDDAVPF